MKEKGCRGGRTLAISLFASQPRMPWDHWGGAAAALAVLRVLQGVPPVLVPVLLLLLLLHTMPMLVRLPMVRMVRVWPAMLLLRMLRMLRLLRRRRVVGGQRLVRLVRPRVRLVQLRQARHHARVQRAGLQLGSGLLPLSILQPLQREERVHTVPATKGPGKEGRAGRGAPVGQPEGSGRRAGAPNSAACARHLLGCQPRAGWRGTLQVRGMQAPAASACLRAVRTLAC